MRKGELMPDLADGETFLMQGSAARPYELKNVGSVNSCSCPAWRNQSVPIEKRTCKHLRKRRGDAAETARVGSAMPPPRKPASAAAATGAMGAAVHLALPLVHCLQNKE
jgi:DNA ligase 1